MKEGIERDLEGTRHPQVPENTRLLPRPGAVLIHYSTVDDEIANLYGLGWPVIPVCAPSSANPNGCTGLSKSHNPTCGTPGKTPLLKGYPDYAKTLPTLDQILFEHGALGLHRHGDVNRAVVVPLGHVIVEADSDLADAELVTLLAGIVTPMRAPRPTRGHAWFLRLPPGVEIKSCNHLGMSGAIDGKAPGSIVVIPDSVHASGHRYTWVPGRAPWDVPIAEIPVELLALILAANAKKQARAARRSSGTEKRRSDNTNPPRLGASAGTAADASTAADVDEEDDAEMMGGIADARPTVQDDPVDHAADGDADEDVGEGVCCSIVASEAHTSQRPLVPMSPSATPRLRRPPPNVDGLIRTLDSTARTIATEGYIERSQGGSFDSRSEMRLALAIAGLHAGGSRRAIKELLLHDIPNTFRVDDHRDPEAVADHDFDEAEDCYLNEVDNAVRVRFFCGYVSRSKLGSPDAAQVRATLCFARSDGTGYQIQHTVNIRLGKPALNELGGEWLQALRALPDEPLLHRAEELLVEQEHWASVRGKAFERAIVAGQRTECLLVHTGSGISHLLPLSMLSANGGSP